MRAELAEKPDCVCLGTLGEAGGESAAGSREQRLGLAVEKLGAGLIFPGCPGADVAVSHHILLGESAGGPKTCVAAAVQGAGGPRDGSRCAHRVPPWEQGCAHRPRMRLEPGGTLPVARNPRVPAGAVKV